MGSVRCNNAHKFEKSLFISLSCCEGFYRLDVSSFAFTYIHTESHKYDDAELIDINLCLNNVDIRI